MKTKNQMITGCLLAILLFISCLRTTAATYHVATNGTDTSAGSETAPFRTVQAAATKAQAGDSVVVHEGAYPENVRLQSKTSSETNRIVFRGDGNVTVGGFYIQSSGVTIDGFEIANDSVGLWDGAIRVASTASGLWILNNSFHHLTNRYGILFISGGKEPELSSQNCIISNNVFNYIGYINVNMYGKNHQVVSNTFANSFNEGDGVRAWGANHRICGNTFTNLGGGAPSSGGHPDILQTFGNYGVSSYNILFENNLAINCLSQLCQLEQIGVPDIRDWTFRNNLFIRVSYAANCDLPGVWWYNNVFYRCTTNTGHTIIFSDGINGKGAANRSGAKNNVFLECGSNPSNNTFGWYIAPPELPDLDCDYNYVAGTAFAPKRTDTVRSVFRFVEEHGVNGGDPGFVSIATNNFQLASGSKLIESGVIIPSFNIDFLGNTRTNSIAYDIGAYQYQGERALPTGKPTPPRNFEAIK